MASLEELNKRKEKPEGGTGGKREQKPFGDPKAKREQVLGGFSDVPGLTGIVG